MHGARTGLLYFSSGPTTAELRRLRRTTQAKATEWDPGWWFPSQTCVSKVEERGACLCAREACAQPGCGGEPFHTRGLRKGRRTAPCPTPRADAVAASNAARHGSSRPWPSSRSSFFTQPNALLTALSATCGAATRRSSTSSLRLIHKPAASAMRAPPAGGSPGRRGWERSGSQRNPPPRPQPTGVGARSPSAAPTTMHIRATVTNSTYIPMPERSSLY